MKGAFLVSTLAVLIGSAVSQNTPWGQCGGINWTGLKTCPSGYYCNAINDYYSQCIPGTGPSPNPTPTSTLNPSSPPPHTPSSTSISVSPPNPSATGVLIRGVKAPVYHLYLQSSGTTPVLGPESSAHRFVISGTILDTTTGLYLNIENASTSYKPLSFGATANFNGWVLEGDTISTKSGSSLGRQLNFLACSTTGGLFKLYLQTGNATPAGESCTMQTIHLPCLC